MPHLHKIKNYRAIKGSSARKSRGSLSTTSMSNMACFGHPDPQKICFLFSRDSESETVKRSVAIVHWYFL